MSRDFFFQEWTRPKAVMSPSDEAEIKILFCFSITRIFIITSTKITDKHHQFCLEWLFRRQFISVFNKSVWQFYSSVGTVRQSVWKIYSSVWMVSQTVWTLCRPFINRSLSVHFSHLNGFLLVSVLPFQSQLFISFRWRLCNAFTPQYIWTAIYYMGGHPQGSSK